MLVVVDNCDVLKSIFENFVSLPKLGDKDG